MGSEAMPSTRLGSAFELWGCFLLLPWLPIVIPLVAWFRLLLWLESLLGRRLAGSLVLAGVWALAILSVLLALTYPDSDLAFRTAVVSTLLLVLVLVPLTGLYAAHWLARSTRASSPSGPSRSTHGSTRAARFGMGQSR